VTSSLNRLGDDFTIAMSRAREMSNDLGLAGYGVIELRGSDGAIKVLQPFTNLITDAGDLYYATRGIAAVSPAAPSDATKVNGMKLGTGTTAVAKNGAGAALVTYLSGSNVVFDATFPSTTNLGAGLGVQGVYKTTWAAGTATNSAIAEAVIVNDQATNATTTAANTIARITFTAVNKGASDVLAITWNHKFLGA
jgi:hypothetical protein